MKTLRIKDITIKDGNVTITGTVTDEQFNSRVQQVTINDFPDDNPKFSRHLQMSNEAIFLKRYGSESFALPNGEFTKLAQSVETTLIPTAVATNPPAAEIKRPTQAPAKT
jgi:hypothetical protein